MGGINLEGVMNVLNRSTGKIGSGSPLDFVKVQPNKGSIFVDAGVGFLHLRAYDGKGGILSDKTIPSSGDLDDLFGTHGIQALFGDSGQVPVYITGKLAALVKAKLGRGKTILPAAASWMAARDLIHQEDNASVQSLAIVELSASGYLIVGVERSGALKNDLLVVNPRCGAGSGVNLDRVMQKLGMARDEVDPLLSRYAGEEGRQHRDLVNVRADRCGVFSSSATISDKNQGIPLDVALATTLKSEVLKACRKLPAGFDKVCLAGRVFHWRFARECAEDYLHAIGVREVVCDPDNTQVLDSLRGMVEQLGDEAIAQPDIRLERQPEVEAYPSFAELKQQHEADHSYLRLPDAPVRIATGAEMLGRPVFVGLDVGSTMAKAVVSDAVSGENLFLNAYSNAGDTIQTLKLVFHDFRNAGVEVLSVRGIGITGSARFQVQQAVEHIYPELAGRVSLLVENYAHARGSIALAREHVQRLKDWGITDLNEDFCILVDIGGEDTKISTIALREAELFNNAMNLKCSAGTGSLMDTLSAMFAMPGVAVASAEAYTAPRAMVINATCAVFLMENARKLQVQGVPRAEILASANWAIVENMSRTLWSQVELPRNAVVLLHGQTMLSEPLPLAVTHRLQTFLNAPAYSLVPPNPGHRACFGLIHTLAQVAPEGSIDIHLDKFLESKFEKRIVQCHGAACDDKSACCNRTMLTCRKEDGSKLMSFTLGGCSAINEMLARKKDKDQPKPVRDTYKEIWDFVDSHHPRSEDPNRLVIPRSFAVSEWAFLFARLFERLGIPVHVDNVRETDLTDAQPLFNIDTCAPHMGAVGQFRRLAAEPHGIILAPQIEFLPTDGKSQGRACTLNQGGVAVALNLAHLAHAKSRFHLFNVDLGQLNADVLQSQLQGRLEPVFRHYGLAPSAIELRAAIGAALEDHMKLRHEMAEFSASLAEEALDQGIPVSVVVGREYILNPGIYDSHVRRLLRDKHMVVLPSYVLDMELDEAYKHIYWRNPHFIVSLLNAVAHRKLHERLRHPRLREVFRRIESGPDLLPVVQVSTFSCGPDSVVTPFVAEIMKQRPFLLIQSDAVIKELAHLENRVNTYVKQLQLGLHERLKIGSGETFDIHTLDELSFAGPIDREHDVIYFPTMSDNRFLTAVLRGAGYTCVDNYDEQNYDLHRLVKQGRRTTGDAVCAPLASVYADLQLAMEDFHHRREVGDPQVKGKRRLLYFDNKGPGPCRQGQYVDVHRLLYYGKAASHDQAAARDDAGCQALPGQGALKFLVGQETEGWNIGIEEWALSRAHQGVVVQGVLHNLLFVGGAACRDYAEYQQFLADYRVLKADLLRLLESFSGPGHLSRALIKRVGERAYLGPLVKYFAYRLHGRDMVRPLRRFAEKWIKRRLPEGHGFEIALTGEIFMRVSQSEEIFRMLLANLGFRRFRLNFNPVWTYMEWTFDEAMETQRDQLERLRSGLDGAKGHADEMHKLQSGMRKNRIRQFVFRNLIVRPLYRAAAIPMSPSTIEVLKQSRELLPTLRPLSEIATYVGEALGELRKGADIVLNVAPNGCMVASMGEVLTPAIMAANETGHGRIQQLFSAEGDVNEELLTLALLKSMGPERYYRSHTSAGAETSLAI
jgi:activator of 2-hydroxyglutaryl-CoA dehydratase/predicted nucleotide-binding protein (sugar kinase/HSP70/actin superfamily)